MAVWSIVILKVEVDVGIERQLHADEIADIDKVATWLGRASRLSGTIVVVELS